MRRLTCITTHVKIVQKCYQHGKGWSVIAIRFTRGYQSPKCKQGKVSSRLKRLLSPSGCVMPSMSVQISQPASLAYMSGRGTLKHICHITIITGTKMILWIIGLNIFTTYNCSPDVNEYQNIGIGFIIYKRMILISQTLPRLTVELPQSNLILSP